MIRTLLRTVMILSLFAAFAAQAQQAWPSRPLRIIVPFAPGSFTDVAARAIAAELTGQHNQQVVVENRTGAGGTIGTEIVARLQLAAKTLKELVDLARATPGEFTFGSGGQGSSAHLAMELFLNVAGVRMLHVPFKGVAASIAEVTAGRIDVSMASFASGMPHVRGGRVQGFAVTGKERHPLLSEVPTFAEAGFLGYNMSYWWGIAMPAGAPPQTVSQLNQEIARATDKPKLKEIFQKQGARAVTSSPAEHSRRVDEEIKVWKNVIVKAGVKLE